MDFLLKVKKYGKCCATEKPLKTTHYVNMVQLSYFASWKYPTHGNILAGTSGMAVAYVHDNACDDQGKILLPVKFAVEIEGDDFIYHPVESLRPVCPPPNATKEGANLSMYTVYENPADLPGMFVAKKWVVKRGNPPHQDDQFILVGRSADEVFEQLHKRLPGLMLIPRDPTDQPHIVATFI